MNNNNNEKTAHLRKMRTEKNGLLVVAQTNNMYVASALCLKCGMICIMTASTRKELVLDIREKLSVHQHVAKEVKVCRW